MYIIQIREVRTGEISFETLEEAKQWHENREGDVYWYYNDEKCKLEKETNLSTEDISKEVDWLWKFIKLLNLIQAMSITL